MRCAAKTPVVAPALVLVLVVAAHPLGAGVNAWTSVAPTGGSVQLIVADPRESGALYASTTGLDLYRTEDGGTLWEKRTPLPRVRFQAVAPADPRLLYAAYGQDFARSADAGITWTMAGRLPTEVTALRVDPSTSTTVYAFGGALYRSTDAGEAWSEITGDLPLGGWWITFLVVDPHAPSTLYARVRDSLYRSRDEGATWAPLSIGTAGAPVAVLAPDPAHPGVLYAATSSLRESAVWRSGDGGNTWHSTALATPAGDLAVSVSGQYVYAVSWGSPSGTVWTSSDGGATWRSASTGRSTAMLALDAVDDSTLWVAGDGVVKSTDAGATWTPAENGLITGRVSALALTDDSSRLYAGAPGRIFSSTDHGATWSNSSPVSNDDFGPLAIPRGQTRTVYAGRSGGEAFGSSGLYRSTDGGETFERADAGLEGRVVRALAIDPGDASKMLAGTTPVPPPFLRVGDSLEDGPALFGSTDAGRTWKSLAPIPATSIVFDPGNAGTVYAGAYKSTDGGATWFALRTGGQALAIDPSRTATLYGTDGDRVYRTNDGGSNWSVFHAGLPPSPGLVAIAVDPSQPSTLYAGGNAGVFRSTDSGENWSRFGDSSSPEHVKSLAVEASGRFVHAATDHGAFDYEIGVEPVPALEALRPDHAPPGGPAFTLLVRGSGFTGGSTVTWNGTSRPTYFLSTRTLTASMAATDLSTPGTATVLVVNGEPGGGHSNALPFFVEPLNPQPIVAGLTPSSAASGGAPFVLDVSGSGFVGGSQILWNGSPRPTKFLSPGLLAATVEGDTPEIASITVVNPAPGGGASNAFPFRVAAVAATWLIPAVLDVHGAVHYTSELVLTNRGSSPSTLRLTYVAARSIGATGSGTVTEALPAGRQMLIGDTLSYLRSKGLPIPDAGPQVGTLRVDFAALSGPNAGYAAARTTFPVGDGRVGPPSPGVRLEDLTAPKVLVAGLRENAAERSNLALINAGSAGDVTLRVTLTGSPATAPGVTLDDVTMAPGQWVQLGSVLARAGLPEGYATVERVGGQAPFLTYGVVNDNVTQDGSVVFGQAPTVFGDDSVLPFFTATDGARTELVILNEETGDSSVHLSYVESLAPQAAPEYFLETLGPGEQRVLPNALAYERSKGGAAGSSAPPGGGTLSKLDATNCLMLARTLAPAPGGGRYAISYAAIPVSGPFSSVPVEGWIYGLRQTSTARSNLAVLTIPGAYTETVTLRVELYDGETGALLDAIPVELAPGRWTQLDSILARYGVPHGYARVVRVAGRTPFVAYGVISDGPTPGSGTGGGAYIPMERP